MLAAVHKKHKGASLTPEQEQEAVLKMMRVEALNEKLKTVVQVRT